MEIQLVHSKRPHVKKTHMYTVLALKCEKLNLFCLVLPLRYGHKIMSNFLASPLYELHYAFTKDFV